MRQIVKKVKNGQEVKFTCSTCGELVHCIFIPTGERRELDWDTLPEKCSCGAKLTNRQPIIDVGNLDIDDVSENMRKSIQEHMRRNIRENVVDNVHGGTRGAVSRGTDEKSDVYARYMTCFENAVSIDYFDMRLNGLKAGDFKVPDNIDHLRIECVKRNISYIESCMEKSSYSDDECEKNELKEKLNILRQKYSDMSRKSGDKKDSDKNNKKRF